MNARMDRDSISMPWYQGGLHTLPGSRFKIEELPHGERMLSFIELNADRYWKSLKYRGSPRLKFHWAQRNPTGGSTTLLHDHARSPVAGCFYIDMPTQGGQLVLKNPMESQLVSQPFPADNMGHNKSMFDHLMDPSNGELIMWPGYLWHSTQPNLSGSARLLLAFDFWAK